jgi:hypothetical protein
LPVVSQPTCTVLNGSMVPSVSTVMVIGPVSTTDVVIS